MGILFTDTSSGVCNSGGSSCAKPVNVANAKVKAEKMHFMFVWVVFSIEHNYISAKIAAQTFD